MSTFDERESAFENKFVHDEQLEFKISARANKLVGLWAAGQLGKTGDTAEAYAKEVVISDLEEPGTEDVVRKLVADLEGTADEDTIRAEMVTCRKEAEKQVAQEK